MWKWLYEADHRWSWSEEIWWWYIIILESLSSELLIFPLTLYILITKFSHLVSYVFCCGIMFGPYICGYSTKKVHAIFMETFYLEGCSMQNWSIVAWIYFHPPFRCYLHHSHWQCREAGSLYSDWDLLLPKQIIKDPDAKKVISYTCHLLVLSRHLILLWTMILWDLWLCINLWQHEDWDDNEFIPDPEDEKPEVHVLEFAIRD